jgi:hypothetical protein
MLAKGAGASQEILNGVVSQLPIRRIAGASEVADKAGAIYRTRVDVAGVPVRDAIVNLRTQKS